MRHLASGVALCAWLSCTSADAQVHAYAVMNGARDLRSVDLSTGLTSLVMSLQSGGLNYTSGITWRPDLRELWAFDPSTSAAPVGRINVQTGVFQVSWATQLSGVEGLTWDPATRHFYLSNLSQLFALNPVTGLTTPRGPLGLPPGAGIVALDVDAAGELWGMSSNGHLLNVSKVTGAARIVSMFPLIVRAFSIDPVTGEHYIAAWSNQNIVLYVGDPGTGTLTYRGYMSSSEIQGLEIVDGACRNDFARYGTGCPGTGGITPLLDAWGCFGSGGRVALRISAAMPGTAGVLFFGLDRAAIRMGNGCDLLISPVFSSPTISLPMFGTGAPGNGFATVSVLIPTGTLLQGFTMQGFLLDLGASGSISGTNGLQFHAP